MKPGAQYRNHKGSPIINILSRINPIPHNDISSRSILILSSHLRLGLPEGLFPVGLPVKILKISLTFLHSGYMPGPSQSSRFNHPDYIMWTVQTMKFLIVEPSPLPILIPLGPKIIIIIIIIIRRKTFHMYKFIKYNKFNYYLIYSTATLEELWSPSN